MGKRMEPLIRHYVSLDYDACLEGSKATLTYHNLVLDYVEEEVHEGIRGPLPVNHSEESFKVPDKFGESTLFFKESDVERYKYDFVLLTDLSMLQTSKAGKELLEKSVLPYNDMHVKPAERKKKAKKGGMVDYIFSNITTSFEVDLLRALGLMDKYQAPKNPEKIKEKYIENLVEALHKTNFIPIDSCDIRKTNPSAQSQIEVSLHGGYLYNALEKIIQEQNLINITSLLSHCIILPKAGLWGYVFYKISEEPLVGLLVGGIDLGFSLWMKYDTKKRKQKIKNREG